MNRQEIALGNAYVKYDVRPYEHKTRYYETDMTGLIHQTNYMKWLEDARMDIMEQMGLGISQMEQLQVACPLLKENISFIGMVKFNDTVIIHTKITRYDGYRMDLEYEIIDKATGERRATAESSHCFVSRAGKPISLKRVYPELETRLFEFGGEETENV